VFLTINPEDVAANVLEWNLEDYVDEFEEGYEEETLEKDCPWNIYSNGTKAILVVHDRQQ